MCLFYQGEESFPGGDVSNPLNWWGPGYQRKVLCNGIPEDVEATGIFRCANRPSPQVAALGQWLVEVSRSLLDPRDTVQPLSLSKRHNLRLASISHNRDAGQGSDSAEVGAESPTRKRSLSYDHIGTFSEGVMGDCATSRSKLGWEPLSSAQRFDYFVHKVYLDHRGLADLHMTRFM